MSQSVSQLLTSIANDRSWHHSKPSSLLNVTEWVSQWVSESVSEWVSYWQALPMIGLGSDKNQNIWKTKKTHQTIHTCESACAFLLRHSHGILAPPILMQLQSNMRDDKYRRVGCWGHRLHVLAPTFLCAQHTSHSLAHFKQWTHLWRLSIVHWTHLWRCSLFKLNSRNLARARCRTWFLPQALPALWAAHRSKRGINHLHKSHRYDKAWWNLIAPNTNLTNLPTKYT